MPCTLLWILKIWMEHESLRAVNVASASGGQPRGPDGTSGNGGEAPLLGLTLDTSPGKRRPSQEERPTGRATPEERLRCFSAFEVVKAHRGVRRGLDAV